MRHLIYINLVVIFLDITLLVIQYANFFYVQGAYKPCVYGVKLRIEFAILNRITSTIRRPSHPSYNHTTGSKSARRSKPDDTGLETFSQRSGAQLLDGSTAEYQNSSQEARLQDR